MLVCDLQNSIKAKVSSKELQKSLLASVGKKDTIVSGDLIAAPLVWLLDNLYQIKTVNSAADNSLQLSVLRHWWFHFCFQICPNKTSLFLVFMLIVSFY